MSKSELSPIEKHLQSKVEEYFGEEPPRFLLGASGGVDSMSLMYAHYRLDLSGIAVHLNYGKRGKESDKDMELVEQMAGEWGFDCHTVKVDATEYDYGNFQQWAREVRYDVFRALKAEYGAGAIAVAHHRDDQIETVLQKLFRGAGLESWSAMQEWDGEIFRPLLGMGRTQVEAYAKEYHIPYRTDRSNLSSDFARNYLRNEWLEGLEQHFPGWKQNIIRLTEQAELFSKAMDRIAEGITDGKDRIDRDAFLHIDEELRRALLLHLLKKADTEVSVSHDALSQVDEVSHLQTGKRIQLTGNYYLMRDRKWFKIVFEQPASMAMVELEKDELAENPFRIDDLEFSVESYREPDFEKQLYLDASALRWPLRLRKWREGDRLQPLGMEGHQNVSDHLTNRKISASQKKKAFVLETFDETICAVIFPPIEKRLPPGTISEPFKCDTETRQSLIIKHN